MPKETTRDVDAYGGWVLCGELSSWHRPRCSLRGQSGKVRILGEDLVLFRDREDT